MWTEIATGGGLVALMGIIVKMQNVRIGKMVSQAECLAKETHMCQKIDEVKTLLEKMDEKREDAKDAFHLAQKDIVQRLSRIEGQLNNKDKGY